MTEKTPDLRAYNKMALHPITPLYILSGRAFCLTWIICPTLVFTHGGGGVDVGKVESWALHLIVLLGPLGKGALLIP